MSSRLRLISLALVALLLASLSVVLGGGTASAVTPPFEPDPNSIGSLAFYDATGARVTGGLITDAPFATYVQASAPGRVGDTKATLYGYLPKLGVATGAFPGEPLTGSTTYPDALAPPPLNGSLPLVKLSSADATLATLVDDFPNTATDAYAGLYQIRVKTSGPGQAADSTYTSATIFVEGNTWTQTYPEPPTATSTSLGVTPGSPVVSGTSVTLTATVTPSNAAGTVQFYDGASPLGAAATVSAGSAQLVTSALSVATHQLTAVFSPTDVATYAGSTSSATSYVVNAAPATPTTTSLGVSPSSPQISGTSLTFTATVSPSGAVGAVQFYDGASPVGSPVTVAAGSAALTTSALAVGAHSLTATFVPTNAALFTGSTSSATSYTIDPVPPTATSTSLGVSPASPVVSGAPVTLTATLTPSGAIGTVQFYDGLTPLDSPVAVAAGSAQLTTGALSVGDHSLTATFIPTNVADFTTSTSSATAFTVDSPPPSATVTTTDLGVSPASPVAFGTTATLTATVAPGSATGTVQFYDGASPLGSPVSVVAGVAQYATAGLSAATHSLSAAFTPTSAAAYTSSFSSTSSFTVDPPPATATTTSLGVSPASPVVAGTAVTLTATVTPGGAVGTVQFYDGASTLGSPVAVSAGSAQLVTSSLSVATHTLKASFVPTNTANYVASESSTTSFVVNPAPPALTSIALGVDPAGPIVEGATATLTATLTAGAVGTVQFYDGASALGSPVAVSAGSAQLATTSLAIGDHSLTATFTPTNPANFTTSTSSAVTLTVEAAPPAVVITDADGNPIDPGEAIEPGSTLTITGTGFAAGEVVTVVVQSDPVELGKVTADGLGNFSIEVTLPDDLEAGSHTVTATGPESAVEFAFVVEAAAEETTTTTEDTTTTVDSGDPTDAGTDTTTGTLPTTGSDTGALLALGLGLVALGCVAALAARRQRLTS